MSRNGFVNDARLMRSTNSYFSLCDDLTQNAPVMALFSIKGSSVELKSVRVSTPNKSLILILFNALLIKNSVSFSAFLNRSKAFSSFE